MVEISWSLRAICNLSEHTYSHSHKLTGHESKLTNILLSTRIDFPLETENTQRDEAPSSLELLSLYEGIWIHPWPACRKGGLLYPGLCGGRGQVHVLFTLPCSCMIIGWHPYIRRPSCYMIQVRGLHLLLALKYAQWVHRLGVSDADLIHLCVPDLI